MTEIIVSVKNKVDNSWKNDHQKAIEKFFPIPSNLDLPNRTEPQNKTVNGKEKASTAVLR